MRRAKRPSAPETWARKGVCPQVTWSWPGAGRFIPAGGGKRAELGTCPVFCFEMGTLRMGQALQPPTGKGGEYQHLEGNAQEANGDGGVRTARTTNLLFSQYHFFLNCSVPFNHTLIKSHNWL